MKLITASDVAARLNLSSLTESATSTYNSYIESATTQLESLLYTSLVRGSAVEYFDIPKTSNLPLHYDIWLSNRFVIGRAKVYLPSTTYSFISDYRDGQLVESSDVVTDRYRGSVRFYTNLYRIPMGSSVLAVKYDYGFNEGDSSIPQWIKDAALEICVYTQYVQGLSNANKKSAIDNSANLKKAYLGIVNKHLVSKLSGLVSTRIDNV